jgi:CDP-paratose 2-epimerase
VNKILVTGGGGFIGSHVAEYFAKRGNEVVVFDNLSRSELLKTAAKREEIALYNWNYLRELDNVELVRGDIRRRDDVEKAAKDVDAIIHTAAQVAVTSSLDDPISDFEINALGTFNVLEAARKSKERPTVIYCSTNKVYGENVNEIPVEEKGKRYVFADYKQGIPEDFSIDDCAHTPYGCSKLAGDLYVQDYGRREEIETGVFRMSCIYGTRQFGSEDQGWVAHFVISTLTGRPITIYGDGKQLRDVLFVTDLVELFDRFLDKSDKYSGEVFNAGGGPTNTLSLLELLELLEKETSIRPQVSYSDWRPSDQKVYISDISKAKKKLGWEPKIGVEEGVSKLISFVRENKELFKT